MPFFLLGKGPDGDLRLRADGQSLAPLEPGSGWAWAAGERFERDGSPYRGDQRFACRLQQQALEQLGVHLQSGFELEWLLAAPDGEGRPLPVIAGGTLVGLVTLENVTELLLVRDALRRHGAGR